MIHEQRSSESVKLNARWCYVELLKVLVAQSSIKNGSFTQGTDVNIELNEINDDTNFTVY